VLIMTTNAGAAEMSKMAMGFGREVREGEDEEAIKRMFTPEFRNRLDAVVGFRSLPPEVIHKVVVKFVDELEAQLADRNVRFELSDAAAKWLADKGYDRLYGARPLSRVIQESIKKPLAEELLFGKLVKGGVVHIGAKGDELVFDITEAKRPERKKKDDDASSSDDEAERIPEPVE